MILPKQNEKNVNEDLPEEHRRGLVVHYVDEMDEVLKLALVPVVRLAESPRKPADEPRPRFGLA